MSSDVMAHPSLFCHMYMRQKRRRQNPITRGNNLGESYHIAVEIS
jgi:hypothetical protein